MNDTIIKYMVDIKFNGYVGDINQEVIAEILNKNLNFVKRIKVTDIGGFE